MKLPRRPGQPTAGEMMAMEDAGEEAIAGGSIPQDEAALLQSQGVDLTPAPPLPDEPMPTEMPVDEVVGGLGVDARGDAALDQIARTAPADETSLSRDYVKKREGEQASDALSRLRQKYVTAKPAETPSEKAKAAQAEMPAPSERQSAGGVVGAVAKDIGKGAIEIGSGRAIWAGLNRAVNEAADTIASAFGVDLDEVADSIEGATGLQTRFQFREPESVTGQIGTTLTQFIVGFVPAIKGMKALQLPALLGKTAGAGATAALAGAAADALVFDEHADRLSNVIESVPALRNPVTEWLAADEDDSLLEGKVKQAVEGVGLGVASEAFMGTLKAFKQWRNAREAIPELAAPKAAAQAAREVSIGQAVDEAVDLTPRDVLLLGGDEKAPLFKVTEKAAQSADNLVAVEGDRIAVDAAVNEGMKDIPGQVEIAGKVGNINLARIREPSDVVEVIKRGAKAVPIEETVTQSTAQARQNIEQWIGPAQARTILEGQSALGRAFTREEIIFTGDLMAQTGKSIQSLAKTIASGKGTDVEKIALKRAVAFQETVLRTVSQQAREAGRALQAFQTGVAGNKLSAQAMRDLMADGASAERMAAVISRLDSPEQISAFIKGGWWKNAGDALFESWMGSKLISPWTHMRNVVGNSLAMMGQVAERGAAGRIGSGAGVVPGEGAAMARGVVSGFNDALRGAASAFRTGLPSAIDATAVKAEVGQAAKRKAISAAKLGLEEGGWLGRAVDFYGEWVNGLAFRGLVAEDEFFKTIARRMQLHALSYRTATKEGLKGEALASRVAELIASPPPAMMDDVISFARHVTFQDQLGQAGGAMNMLRNRTPFGRYVLPFLQTPANIFKYSMARTPLALATPTFWADAAAGGARRDLALAKLGLGSLVMANFADWVGQGYATGQAPSDPGERQLWDRQGKLPYAVNIGGKWVQYNQMEPLGLSIGIAADVAQIMDVADEVKGLASDPAALDRAYKRLIDAGFSPQEANKLTQRAEDQLSVGATALPGIVVQSLAYNLLEKSYLSGVSNIAEVIFAPSSEMRGQAAQRYIQDFTVGFVPMDGAIRWAERITDPEIREAKGFVEALKAMTPGLSSELPGIPNLWGEPRKSAVATSPFGMKDATPSAPDAEMARLGMDVSMPDRVIRGVRLAPAEYVEFVGLAGNGVKHPRTGLGAKDTLTAIIDGTHPDKGLVEEYRRASDGPDGRKALFIQKTMTQFREAARNEMLRRHPELAILSEEMKRSVNERKGGRVPALAQ